MAGEEGWEGGGRGRGSLGHPLGAGLDTETLYALRGTHTTSWFTHTRVLLCTVFHIEGHLTHRVPGVFSYHILPPQGGCASPAGGLTAPPGVTPWEVQPPSPHESHQSPVWLHCIERTGHAAPHTPPHPSPHTCSHIQFHLHRPPGPHETTQDMNLAALVHVHLHVQSHSPFQAEWLLSARARPSPHMALGLESQVLSCRSPPGLQPRPSHRAEQEGDDLPLRDAGLRGGAHHAGGQTQDDAHAPGGAARPGLQVGLHDQAGAGRHPQVRHGGALQGRRGGWVPGCQCARARGGEGKEGSARDTPLPGHPQPTASPPSAPCSWPGWAGPGWHL